MSVVVVLASAVLAASPAEAGPVGDQYVTFVGLPCLVSASIIGDGSVTPAGGATASVSMNCGTTPVWGLDIDFAQLSIVLASPAASQWPLPPLPACSAGAGAASGPVTSLGPVSCHLYSSVPEYTAYVHLNLHPCGPGSGCGGPGCANATWNPNYTYCDWSFGAVL